MDVCTVQDGVFGIVCDFRKGELISVVGSRLGRMYVSYRELVPTVRTGTQTDNLPSERRDRIINVIYGHALHVRIMFYTENHPVMARCAAI